MFEERIAIGAALHLIEDRERSGLSTGLHCHRLLIRRPAPAVPHEPAALGREAQVRAMLLRQALRVGDVGIGELLGAGIIVLIVFDWRDFQLGPCVQVDDVLTYTHAARPWLLMPSACAAARTAAR